MSFIGAHHAYHRKKVSRKGILSSVSMVIERIVFPIGFLSVASNIPQLWNVWVTHDTSGVSLLSWTAFFVGSIFWFGYGWLHRAKAIMVVNGCLVFIQAAIVLGLIIKP